MTYEQNQQFQDDNAKLIDDVIKTIKEDIEYGDTTAISSLLANIPKQVLIEFLPEEDWSKY